MHAEWQAAQKETGPDGTRGLPAAGEGAKSGPAIKGSEFWRGSKEVRETGLNWNHQGRQEFESEAFVKAEKFVESSVITVLNICLSLQKNNQTELWSAVV